MPDGLPAPALQQICDDLLEASIPDEHKHASTALAVDWTDVETFSRPPPHGTRDCADPEAWWGHRSGGGPGQDSELFFGYYLSAGTMMREEHGPPVPELTQRMTVCSCDTDPARALVPVLTAMPEAGIPLGDILDDSGYAHRDAEAWAIPLRQAGAQLSRTFTPPTAAPKAPTTAPSSPTATSTARPHPGCCWNSARSPATPPRPKPPRTTPGQPSWPATNRAHHQRRPRRLPPGDLPCRHWQDPLPATPGVNDPEPAAARDPHPARHPRACCHQQTITVPPQTCAKTAQKHDYPSAAHRKSYARRTGAERTFSTAKDPASNNIARGWTRLMGLAPLMLWLACLLVVRNQRILTTWDARQADNARRAAAGLPPRTRRRRRKTLTDLATAGTPP